MRESKKDIRALRAMGRGTISGLRAAEITGLSREEYTIKRHINSSIYHARWNARRKAYSAFKTAKKCGGIVPKPCEICCDSDAHAHHDDYRRPLDVRWLCPAHHGAAHGELIWKNKAGFVGFSVTYSAGVLPPAVYREVYAGKDWSDS